MVLYSVMSSAVQVHLGSLNSLHRVTGLNGIDAWSLSYTSHTWLNSLAGFALWHIILQAGCPSCMLMWLYKCRSAHAWQMPMAMLCCSLQT